MYIKSRELLPKDQQVTPEGEEDEDDPRWELIRQLVEYKKFKDAAAKLQTLELRQEQVYPRLPVKPEFEAEPAQTTASIFDLLSAVTAILKRVQQREDLRDIFEDKWTVSEKIELIRQVLQERASVKFSELFAGAITRAEVVVMFLALLELIRLKQLLAIQNEPFGEIEICRAPAPVSFPDGRGSDPGPTEPRPSGSDPMSEPANRAHPDTPPGTPASAGSEGPILQDMLQPLPAEAGVPGYDAEAVSECVPANTPAKVAMPAADAPIPEPLSTLNSQLSTPPPPPPSGE
jgi:segregation and condensation protein A